MTLRTRLHTALALLAFSAASAAMAEPLTLQSSSMPFYLDQGRHAGSFDAAFLPKNVVINSVRFSFLFVDDSDVIPYLDGTLVTSSSTVPGSGNTRSRSETVNTTTTMPRTGVGQQESVALSFGSSTFTGATREEKSDVIVLTNAYTSTQTLYLRSDSSSCTKADWDKNRANCQQVFRTTNTQYQNRIITTDYTGEILLGGSLMGDSGLLAALLRDRKLDFNLDVLGDLNLLDATLDIDFTPFDTSVPEPASLPLLGIAMLGFAGTRRKRRA